MGRGQGLLRPNATLKIAAPSRAGQANVDAVKIDLHSHSTRSDGLLSPAALVDRAAGQGVTHLALTDHDAVDGIAEARASAAGRLELVGGMEITADFRGREVHVLGLFVQPHHPEIQAFCAATRRERATRIERMVEKLARVNIKVRLDDVLAEANGATLARPHLARTLVAYGYAPSLQRAFDHFLAEGRPGYVERAQPTTDEAIALMRRCGAVTSIAHPGVNKLSRHELADLAAEGLDGVEAFHPDHPPNQAEAYQRWGAACGLRATGGSDFHGDGAESHGPPGIRSTPPADFEALAALARDRSRAGS